MPETVYIVWKCLRFEDLHPSLVKGYINTTADLRFWQFVSPLNTAHSRAVYPYFTGPQAFVVLQMQPADLRLSPCWVCEVLGVSPAETGWHRNWASCTVVVSSGASFCNKPVTFHAALVTNYKFSHWLCVGGSLFKGVSWGFDAFKSPFASGSKLKFRK